MLPNNPRPQRGYVNPGPAPNGRPNNGYPFAAPSGRGPLRPLPNSLPRGAQPPNPVPPQAQRPQGRAPPPLNNTIQVPQQNRVSSNASTPTSMYSSGSSVGSSSGLLGPKGRVGMPVYDVEKGVDFYPSQTLVVPPRFGPPKNQLTAASGKSGLSSTSTTSLVSNATSKIALSANPELWEITPGTPGSSADDWLHNPNPARDRKNDRAGSIFTARGFANIGCLVITFVAIVALFAGFPVLSHYANASVLSTFGGYNLGGVNASGQVPVMPGNFGLIDKDTPASAYTKPSYNDDGTELQLVFSDEFNTDGRTFYPGDDPYWEAEDLHYWQTNNLEWYDPAAVTTQNGNLVITLTKQETHDLNYQGGLISTWNKFCFTGGLLEVNAILPGASNIQGLWPAIWAMGNLGRMGYGASLEGMWPYSYNSCDVGTLPNQTFPDGTPAANTVGGLDNSALSFLPGQRTSACTCAGEDHPGPQNADGSYVGRGAPEIDVLEATINKINGQFIGEVSQSAQWAPFNEGYKPNSEGIVVHAQNSTTINSFIGNNFQQTTSALVVTNNECAYEASGANACYSVYGFQYSSGVDGYITWVSDGRASWTLNGDAVGPDSISGASQRVVPDEPMYIIANLGISLNFGPIDFANLQFPANLYIDYVRVYQPKDQINIGCNPDARPTEKYINDHIEAYTNANLTTWAQYGQTFPKNKLVDTC